jgi:hypothetical protein
VKCRYGIESIARRYRSASACALVEPEIWRASGGSPAKRVRIASGTKAPTPGECGRPRTVTSATSRKAP